MQRKQNEKQKMAAREQRTRGGDQNKCVCRQKKNKERKELQDKAERGEQTRCKTDQRVNCVNLVFINDILLTVRIIPNVFLKKKKKKKKKSYSMNKNERGVLWLCVGSEYDASCNKNDSLLCPHMKNHLLHESLRGRHEKNERETQVRDTSERHK